MNRFSVTNQDKGKFFYSDIFIFARRLKYKLFVTA